MGMHILQTPSVLDVSLGIIYFWPFDIVQYIEVEMTTLCSFEASSYTSLTFILLRSTNTHV
jgi:hypothetical protein